jgi:hypothetical protein
MKASRCFKMVDKKHGSFHMDAWLPDVFHRRTTTLSSGTEQGKPPLATHHLRSQLTASSVPPERLAQSRGAPSSGVLPSADRPAALPLWRHFNSRLRQRPCQVPSNEAFFFPFYGFESMLQWRRTAMGDGDPAGEDRLH